MAAIEAKIPTLTCVACREARDVIPRAIYHVNQLENPAARELIVKSGFSFVVTSFEPPPDWLLMELHFSGGLGGTEKTPRWLCPLCSSMEAVVAKVVIDTLKSMRAK